MTPSEKLRQRKRDRDKEDDLEEGLKLVFGEASDKIQELLEGNDTDSAITLSQRKMLASTLALIPKVETLVQDSGGARGVYQYNTLINTARCLIEDISAQQDAALIADSINANYVHPTVGQMAQFTMDTLYRLRGGLKDYIEPEDKKVVGKMIEETAVSIARYFEEKSTELQNKISQRIVD
jgi:hypothetical protein